MIDPKLLELSLAKKQAQVALVLADANWRQYIEQMRYEADLLQCEINHKIDVAQVAENELEEPISDVVEDIEESEELEEDEPRRRHGKH